MTTIPIEFYNKYMTNTQILKKIFIGFPLHGELKSELSQSKEWNLLKILPNAERKKILEVHFQNKEYLGIYLPDNEKHTVESICKAEKELCLIIQNLCPKLHIEKQHPVIFTQPFLP